MDSSRLLLLISCVVLPSAVLADCGELDPAMKQDLEVFETEVLAKDVPYQRALEAGARGLKAVRECPPASRAAFELALAAILAQGGNGHSTVLTMRWPKRYNRLPFETLRLDDGLHVLDPDRAAAYHGCRVRTIDGHQVADVEAAWAGHVGGAGGLGGRMFHDFVQSPELLHAAGIARRPDRVQLEFDGCPGATLAALPPAEEGRGFSHSTVLALSAAGHTESIPVWLASPDEPFRLLRLTDDTAFLQLRSNIHSEIDIRTFAKDAGEQLEAWAPEHVIFDQRLNLGGDLNTTRNLMSTLAEVTGPDGHIVALVSRRTFSAAIHNLAFLKQAAGDRLSIIGKPVGDDLEFWSEGDVVELPASGALFLYATERHNYRTGCPEDDCHPPIRNNPVAIESIEPDLEVSYTWADFKAGRDPMLRAAFERIRSADPDD